MIFAPKFVYGATTLTLTISQRLWAPTSPTLGGSDRAVGGQRETYLLRRDNLLYTRIRCTEAEWPLVFPFITWGQEGGIYDMYPDAAVSTHYSCYMESPLLGEEIKPERGDEAVWTYEYDVVHRKADGTAFDVRAYP